MIQPVRGVPEEPVAGRGVVLQAAGLRQADERSRRARGPWPSAGRSCPRNRRPTAGGRAGTRVELEPRRRLCERSSQARRAQCRPRRRRGERAQHHRGDRRQAAGSSRDRLAAVVRLAAVAVAVDRDEHRRLELGETVDHAGDADVGRAGRPDRTEAGAGQERRPRAPGRWAGSRDAVTRADARAPAAWRPAPPVRRAARPRSARPAGLSERTQRQCGAGVPRKTCSARLSRAPGNQRAPGISGRAEHARRTRRGRRSSKCSQTRPRSPRGGRPTIATAPR